MDILYENIKKYRIERGISQTKLAELVGYDSHSTITRIEKGEIDLPKSKVIQIADALGVAPAVLMGWSADTDDGTLIIEEVKRMSPSDKKHLLEYIKLMKRMKGDTQDVDRKESK
jgi:transcriptional regulator with XRE-family HTH domain